MNLVGKIFTLLIAFMAIVFGSFSVAVHLAHRNWRDEVVNPEHGYRVKLDNSEKQIQELASRMESAEVQSDLEIYWLEDDLTKATNERDNLLKEKNAAVQENSDLKQSLRQMTAALDAEHKTLDNLRQQADSMRGALKTAEEERDRLFKQLVDLKDQLNIADSERLRLEKSNADVVAQLAKARECLAYLGENENSDYKSKAPPVPLEGVVTAVSGPDVVQISVGSDDGVRKGHKFEVVRMGAVKTYVGRIVVLETTVDRAICRPDKTMLRSQIQRGDRVYADLNAVK